MKNGEIETKSTVFFYNSNLQMIIENDIQRAFLFDLAIQLVNFKSCFLNVHNVVCVA